MGAQAAIVAPGRCVWSAAVGWADIQRKIRITTETTPNIASVSKAVTAAAVMQLVETGRVQLHRPVNDSLPFAVSTPSHPPMAIAIRQLVAPTAFIDERPRLSAELRLRGQPEGEGRAAVPAALHALTH